MTARTTPKLSDEALLAHVATMTADAKWFTSRAPEWNSDQVYRLREEGLLAVVGGMDARTATLTSAGLTAVRRNRTLAAETETRARDTAASTKKTVDVLFALLEVSKDCLMAVSPKVFVAFTERSLYHQDALCRLWRCLKANGPRYDLGPNNPNDGRPAYTIHVGNEGTLVIYVRAHGASDRATHNRYLEALQKIYKAVHSSCDECGIRLDPDGTVQLRMWWR